MRQGLDGGVFPGAVLLVACGGRPVFHEAYGKADMFTGEPVTTDTIFDLASLTKPLATALCAMVLVEEKLLRLDDRVGAVLPAFAETDKAGVTVEQLLRHTAGLPDYRPYYETLVDRPVRARKAHLQKLLVEERLVTAAGTKTRYSDIGFLLLQMVIEAAADTPLPELARNRIFSPLELDSLHFPQWAPPFGFERYASTEKCPWRRRMLRGEVHDDNAWALGGVAGHAGLFGTAADVWRLSQVLLELWCGRRASGPVSPQTVRLFLDRPGAALRALGFDAPDPVNPSCGSRFSKIAVGHLGFTGTSFWIDPESSVIVVLLTNRVHPSRENQKIRSFRPMIHDAAVVAAVR
jgi:CubicO group peptidase (beta-lactamase class C family)